MRDMKTEVAIEKVTLTTTTVAEIVFNGDKDICNEITVTLTVKKKTQKRVTKTVNEVTETEIVRKTVRMIMTMPVTPTQTV